jgi:hypothetical protein
MCIVLYTHGSTVRNQPELKHGVACEEERLLNARLGIEMLHPSVKLDAEVCVIYLPNGIFTLNDKYFQTHHPSSRDMSLLLT